MSLMYRITFLLWLTALFIREATAQPSTTVNFVVTNKVKQPGITHEGQIAALPIHAQGKSQSIAYFNGLGWPLQTVVTKGSADARDIVSPFVYDVIGRQSKSYLPYAETNSTNPGSYQSDWAVKQAAFYNGGLSGVDIDPSPFSQTVFEP